MFEKKHITPRGLSSYYINLPQGFAARFILGETPYAGIYTEGVITCYVIVVEGRTESGKPCFSMMHADGTTTEEFIKAERNWAGKDSRVCIYKHESPYKPGTPGTKLHPTGEMLAAARKVDDEVSFFSKDDDTLTVSMSEKGELHVTRFNRENSDAIPPLVNHPDMRGIYGVHKLNAMVSSLDMSNFHVADSKNSSRFLPAPSAINRYIRDDYLIYRGSGDKFVDMQPQLTEGAKRILNYVEQKIAQSQQNAMSIMQIGYHFNQFLLTVLNYSQMHIPENEVARTATGLAECYCYIHNQIELLNVPELDLLYDQAKRYCAQTSKTPASHHVNSANKIELLNDLDVRGLYDQPKRDCIQTNKAPTPHHINSTNKMVRVLCALAICYGLQQTNSTSEKASLLFAAFVLVSLLQCYFFSSKNEIAVRSDDIERDVENGLKPKNG
jgi:hypothetical protein